MRDHGSDDLMTRGARAAFATRLQVPALQPTCVADQDGWLVNLRALSASDAALARAIDAVPGRTHAGRDLRPFMTLEPTG